MAGNESGAVVVTGASTGIGRAAALHLDGKGYRVFAGIRKQADAKSIEEAG
jgi:NADP-dependent 3-hydroxy acid dehydrogenase YdfG